jgi:hypothetical protein
VVHVAWTVLVTVPKYLVHDCLVRVMVFVTVVVTAFGVTVLILLAVPLGMITVENGPVVTTSVEVVVMVCVRVGVSVLVSVTVAVYVLVTGVPTVK